MDALELTRKLIDIRSTTGEEGEIMVFLSEYLENMGFRVSKQTVEKDRFNILAARVVTSTAEIKEQLSTTVDARGELDFYFACEPVITQY
jgi:acetylornithine deacetylase/succinyl-diaminopimelate desuccinylase-like protein